MKSKLCYFGQSRNLQSRSPN